LDEPLSSSEPTGRRPDLSPQREIHSDPESTTRRTEHVTGRRMLLVSSFEDLHPLVLVPEHVGRRREQFQIRPRERRYFVSERKRLLSVPPRKPGVRRATAFELV